MVMINELNKMFTPFYLLSVCTNFPTAALAVIQASSHMSPECEKFGIKSLCYHAFPLCDTQAATPTPRKICKDECELLENNLCKNEYVMAKRHNLIGES